MGENEQAKAQHVGGDGDGTHHSHSCRRHRTMTCIVVEDGLWWDKVRARCHCHCHCMWKDKVSDNRVGDDEVGDDDARCHYPHHMWSADMRARRCCCHCWWC